jgi:broad specificity phosphatase PhoE
MPTRLLLVAHAATTATRRAAFPLDEPIEPAARELALRLAPGLGRSERAYAAPERRAQETAVALGLTPETQLLLADIDLGRWKGRSFDEMLAEGPDAIAAWTSDPASRAHGGESVEELIARVRSWLDHQREEHGRVVAVTHPAIIRAAVVIALGAPPASFWRIDAGPLTRTELRSDERRWTLRAMIGAA